MNEGTNGRAISFIRDAHATA